MPVFSKLLSAAAVVALAATGSAAAHLRANNPPEDGEARLNHIEQRLTRLEASGHIGEGDMEGMPGMPHSHGDDEDDATPAVVAPEPDAPAVVAAPEATEAAEEVEEVTAATCFEKERVAKGLKMEGKCTVGGKEMKCWPGGWNEEGTQCTETCDAMTDAQMQSLHQACEAGVKKDTTAATTATTTAKKIGIRMMI